MSRFIALAAVVLVLAGCISDVVTSRYSTLEEARADRLFERGWLPDFLPPSARHIRTSNNLDLSTSEGEFYFSPEHAQSFYKHLTRGLPRPEGSEQWEQQVSEHREAGLEPWWHQERGYTWVFFCSSSAGLCKYSAW